jgi:hypothetical protein
MSSPDQEIDDFNLNDTDYDITCSVPKLKGTVKTGGTGKRRYSCLSKPTTEPKLDEVKGITLCQWPHSTEADRVHIGDEHGLKGHFQQAIGQAFRAVLEAKAVNLYFADFKSSGSNYDKIPDVVGLQDIGGNTTIKLVRELKIPWAIQHDLHSAVRRPRELRQKIA